MAWALAGAALLAGSTAVAQESVTALTRDQQEAFLQSAEIVGDRPVGRGVTGIRRLTLRHGGVTHDAAFQSVDERRSVQHFPGAKRPEINFRDSYRYNIAASQLAVLVGLGDMAIAARLPVLGGAACARGLPRARRGRRARG